MSSIVQTPFSLGSLVLKNRIVVAPLQQKQGTPESYATDYHTGHYARLAGKPSLVIIESTSVSPDGRLYINDIGLFTDAHIEPLRRVAGAVKDAGSAVFVQLSHGGRKAAPDAVHRLVAPSAVPYSEETNVPEALTAEEIRAVVEAYKQAARRSVEAGFDGIEVHAAHGFLLHEFLSPLSNLRTDEYGGSVENRARLLRDVLTAIRGVVGEAYPVIVRVSASDYAEGGLTPAEVARLLAYVEPLIQGVDVSSGGLLPIVPQNVIPGYQLPFAAFLKSALSVPIIAVGGLHTHAQAEQAIADGLADLVAVGRPLLENPDFTAQVLGLVEPSRPTSA